MELSKSERKRCRVMADVLWQGVHIVIEPGCEPPKLTGRKHYWTTPGGTNVAYPRAYKWKVIYHPSTRKITVGSDWILEQRKNNTDWPDDWQKLLEKALK